MDDIPIGALFGALVLLILLSAFFSASETSMMALNRYRLKHLAESGHRRARIAQKLLETPDRLLGTILLGNNLVNMAAAAIATVIALKLYGQFAIGIATFLMTLVILVFAEVPPKTIAVLHPERIAFPAAYVLYWIQKVFHPIVWLVNHAGDFILRIFTVSRVKSTNQLSSDELRTVVKEAGTMIPKSHQAMLLRILELENITVEDVMVPRSAIEGIDIEDDWEEIVNQLATSHHTRLPVYRGTLDNVIGVLHIRRVLHISQSSEFNKQNLLQVISEPFFIPEGTRLTQQLLALQKQRRQLSLVVDEYGDLKGLVTLEEILEEIVGEFTSHVPGIAENVREEEDGSYLISGQANIRDLNRKMDWQLPIKGPKTLNGLILEFLENIPKAGTGFEIAAYKMEIVQTRGTAVSVVRLRPPPHPPAADAKAASAS